ncbi:MAG TPA: phosphoribosyl-AMP cyclohydrolase, partial [Ktedonobacteraceae bacterium]|nr:phosphoribosyl-AMP cyclohydrolase [Ktedonobacteraceae bacterium]
MLTFDRQGLIPVAIQDDATNDVLMLAFMNQQALELTRATGYTHFYSRSRNAIWRKGEQSGHTQEVRAIFVNCEENSLLIRVVQHGEAACHTGYRSCYYRQLLPDGSYETVAARVFDPETVYGGQDDIAPLESAMRTLYSVYLYLRDRDLSEESNTSRLLHESFDPESGTRRYLLARLADELQELAEVQSGEHSHAGREPDTILEGSQVGYWLMLLAATYTLSYDEFLPHVAILQGYDQLSLRRDAIPRVHEPGVENPPGREESRPYENSWAGATQQCLNKLSVEGRTNAVEGLQAGFALVGRACA